MFKGDDVLSSLKFLSAWQVENLDSSIGAFNSYLLSFFPWAPHEKNFSIQLKLLRILKRGKMVWKFPGKVSRKSENFLKAKH